MTTKGYTTLHTRRASRRHPAGLVLELDRVCYLFSFNGSAWYVEALTFEGDGDYIVRADALVERCMCGHRLGQHEPRRMARPGTGRCCVVDGCACDAFHYELPRPADALADVVR